MPSIVNPALTRCTVRRCVGLVLLVAVEAPASAETPSGRAPAPRSVVPAEASRPRERATGHSYHGEAFDEGPRQSAVLLGGTGRVRFPVATAVPEAQKFCEQGLGQLHGFWYFEAERSFRQAAALDPGCAMAYWGLAWANVNNETRAKEFVALAAARKGAATDRERLYVDAAKAYFDAGPGQKKERGEAYVKALEGIVHAYPDDVEAKALLALQLWLDRDRTPIPSRLAVDALLGQVFAAEPEHPAHHYRIHLWDDERPEAAVASAARCGPAAPAIAHMWHMPAHTYSKLKRYHDAAWQQEASARVDHAHTARAGLLPDRIHNFAHNNEWLVRSLNHVGRSDDAVALAKNLVSLPRHPKYNTPEKRGSAYYGRLRLLETLDRFERWEELIGLADGPYLDAPADDAGRAVRERFLGKALFLTGRKDRGEAVLAELRDRLTRRKVAAYDAETAAEAEAKKSGKDEKGIADARAEARRPIDDDVKEIEKAARHVEAWAAAGRGEFRAAYEQLRDEDGADGAEIARLRFEAGERDEALRQAREYVGEHENEVVPLVRLVDLLWRAGNRDEAATAFERLRGISSDVSLADPPLARLGPVAEALGLPADWRRPREAPVDPAVRPDLASLGPFLWEPPSAADFRLADSRGEPRGLGDFAGRPVVVIFYLGNSCLHCATQLQAFADEARSFEEAGVSLLAVSSDAPDGLGLAVANYDDGAFPIPLLSDPELAAFKAYGCHDDFEGQPLHGTFLIDGAGRVRWRDVGPEPFGDLKFLLAEARRLLALGD